MRISMVSVSLVFLLLFYSRLTVVHASSCVDIGNETRSCLEETLGGEVTETFTVRCNTTSGQYDVLDTTRCGDLSVLFCRNGRSVQSFCLYAASCDYTAAIITDQSQFTTSGAIKQVSCGGLTLSLQYTYTSSTGECRYSLNETTNPLINTRLLMAFTNLAASEVWALHPGLSGGSDLQSAVPASLTLSAVCLDLKAYATNTDQQFECVVPFVNQVGTYCTLASIVRLKCNEHDIRCDRQLDDRYTCVNTGTADVLDMSCSGNTVDQIARMIIETTIMADNDFTDLSNLTKPINLIDGRTDSQCTEMALTCRDTPNSVSDHFTCAFPFVGPGNSIINSSFCELAYTFQLVSVSCYAQQIACFNQSSRTGPHLCIYNAGNLFMNCVVNASLLTDLYTLNDQLLELLHNCTSTVGCNPADFQRLEAIRQRSLLSYPGSDSSSNSDSESEEDRTRENEFWGFRPQTLDTHLQERITHLQGQHQLRRAIHQLQRLNKNKNQPSEPLLALRILHIHQNVPAHRVLTTQHGILHAGSGSHPDHHTLYSAIFHPQVPIQVQTKAPSVLYQDHLNDVHYYAGRLGGCIDAAGSYTTGCRNHLNVHPLAHRKHLHLVARPRPMVYVNPKKDPDSDSGSGGSDGGELDSQRQQLLSQRPWTSRRLLWSLTDIENAYNNITGPLNAAETIACNAFLDVCSVTDLTCVGNDLLAVVDKKSRDTFCTQSLADSCQNFTGNPPVNVTRVFVTTNVPLEQYTIRCPVIDNPLPNFADNTGASDLLFHDITCTRVPVTGQCYYLCTASTAILTLQAFPVLASVILNPALTGFSTGERIKCAHIYSVAQDTAADENNVFFCPLPYQTTHSTIITSQSQNVTIIKDICVLSTLVSQIQLNCGEMLVTCNRDFSTLLFTCVSNTFNSTSNVPKIRAIHVPESVISPPPALTQNQRCIQLRDIYATNFSCPLTGPCVINNATTCNRTNSATVFCSSTFDITQAPQIIQFDCGLSAFSNLTVPISCNLNPVINASDPDSVPTYSCSQSYRQSQAAVLASYSFSLSSPPLTASCGLVDASTLALTFAPPNGAAIDILNYTEATLDPSDFERNLERCLFVKRSCNNDQDVFHCTCSFLQDTLSNEFCDVPGPSSSSGFVNAVQINETLTCGETPIHSIQCTNGANATGTVFGQWTRCSIPTTATVVLGSVVLVPPGPLDLDCLVRTTQYTASRTDNSTCELLRIQCQFPFECDSGLDCECPPTSVSSQTRFDCKEPAQVCRSNLCQFQETSFTNHSVGNTSDPLVGNDICDFQPPVISLQCQSPPFGPQHLTTVIDIRTGARSPFPIYNITCLKQTVGVHFQQLVLYTCSNTNDDNTTIGHEMSLSVTVPFKVLKFFFRAPDTACLALGQAAVEANAVRCSGPYLSSHDYPYCSTAVEDPSSVLGNFTCDGLLITCTPDSDINNVRCFSDPSSIYWHLGANRDNVRFPNPFNFSGCRLGPVEVVDSLTGLVTNLGVPKEFYKNPEERCQNILHKCVHSCLDSVTFNDTGVELLVAEKQNISICQSYLSGRTQFKCDTQDIICTPVDLTSAQQGNLTAATGVVQGADFERNNKFLNCTYVPTVETIFNNSLELQCFVNVFAFTQQPDTCRALISECRRTSGTVRCLGNYRRTDDAPFCTLQYSEQQIRTHCNLGFWHSTSEGINLVPRTALDLSCYDYDLDNLWQGIVPTAGNPATDPDAGAPSEAFGGPPEALVLNRLSNVALQEECSLFEPEYGLTCRRRGYISYDQFLRRTAALSGGTLTYERLAYLHFTKDTNRQNKRYWCLWSYERPEPVCAVKPGMDLPMCTVECPPGLAEVSINGSRTHYCCRDPDSCTTVDDPRNCVLGRHDPTCDDQPWSCANNDSTNAYLLEDVDLKTVMVIRESQNVSIVPTRICPPNPLNELSAYALPDTRTLPKAQTFDKRFAQELTAIHDDTAAYGFVVIPDRTTGRQGLYVLGRPGQLTFYNAPETDQEHFLTSLMVSVDPYRRHDLSRTEPYHLHPASDDTAFLQAAVMVSWPDPDIPSTSIFVERNYGFKCPDMRLNWVEYLFLNPGALGRTIARTQAHLRFMGADDVLIRAMDFSTLDRLNIIRIDQRHNIFDHSGPNGSIAFPFRKFLQVNLAQQIALDLASGVTWDGLPYATNATFVFDSASGLIRCNGSSCPNTTSDTASWRSVYPHYDAVKTRVPIWGYLNGDTDDSLESNPDSTLFVTMLSGLSGNAPKKTVQIGFSALDPEIDVVQNPNFWYLIGYMAWWDWVTQGFAYTRGHRRASPSLICSLNTPLYVEGLLSPDGKFVGGDNAAICPRPVVPSYNWRTDGTSLSTQMIGPFPNPFHQPRIHNSIPCGGKGICNSASDLSLPGSGTCICFAGFQTETNLFDLGEDVFEPPSSLVFEACENDIRGICTDDLASVGVICAGHGRCVSNFMNNRRISECRCGNFPIDPSSRTKQRCNQLGNCYSKRPRFFWEEGPWVKGDFANNLCTVPRRGCRTPGPWNRPGANFSRGESHACVLPPIDTSSGLTYGSCVLVPGYIDITADASWTCQCNTGQYGKLCEYFTLENRCFDPARERFTLPVGQVRTTVTDVIWNRHVQRFEPLAYTSLTITGDLLTAPRFRGRGNACSNHGFCSHERMNNDTAERWELQPGAVLTSTFETPGELAFQTAVLNRLLAQKCTCDTGWTGQFCDRRECTGGCGNGTCFSDPTRPSAAPVCQCPRDSSGRLLVEGSQCEGLVCAGRGDLVHNTTTGAFSCSCHEPFVQTGSKIICDLVCDCGIECGALPGNFTLLGRMKLPGCQCSGTTQVLCNQEILAFGNTTVF